MSDSQHERLTITTRFFKGIYMVKTQHFALLLHPILFLLHRYMASLYNVSAKSKAWFYTCKVFFCDGVALVRRPSQSVAGSIIETVGYFSRIQGNLTLRSPWKLVFMCMLSVNYMENH